MSNLPDLPKQHKQKEADFGITLRRWIEKNPTLISSTWELKHTRGKDSLPFNEVTEDQVAYALSAERGAFIRVQGVKGEPDYVYIKGPAYIVVKYPKVAYAISINNFLFERDHSKRKSLTVERAKEISTYRLAC